MKKGKYEIRHKDKLIEVDALEFAVFGYGTLIAHRDTEYPSMWTVSEPRTGLSVRSRFATRKSAMQEATASILKWTPDQFEHYIKAGIYNGLKTRYQKENYE